MDLGEAVGLVGSAPAGQAQASERHSADAGSECGAPRHSGGSGVWRGSDASAGTVTVLRSRAAVGRMPRHDGGAAQLRVRRSVACRTSRARSWVTSSCSRSSFDYNDDEPKLGMLKRGHKVKGSVVTSLLHAIHVVSHRVVDTIILARSTRCLHWSVLPPM